MNGTSPPVHPYYPQCVKCPAGTNNWAKYLAVSLLPTTLFFLVTMIFRFRATSPNLNGFIIFCQILSSPVILRRGNQLYMYRHTPYYVHERVIVDIYLSYISIWNLLSVGLSSILPASKCHNTAGTVSGLHHSSLPPCPDHPHIHTSHPPLLQLQTCSVSVEALPQVLHSLSKAV